MTGAPQYSQPFLYDGADEFARLLAELASAEGGALFEPKLGSDTLVRRAHVGANPPALEELGYDQIDRLQLHKRWVTLPLYTDGLISAVLILVFASEEKKHAARPMLRKIVPIFETLIRFAIGRSRQLKLAARISDLEAEIASEKILERARGLLEDNPNWNEATVDLIDRHVSRVVASCQFGQVLEERLREMTDIAAERDLTSRAKIVLQERMGLSEDRAYLYLRNLSRQRRKRIHEIAKEVLDKENA